MASRWAAMRERNCAPREDRISSSVIRETRVVVTRPLPQGEQTAQRLREMGYTPILAPMLRIEAVASPELPQMAGVQAVLATSANGIEHFANLSDARDIKVLTVGDRTASVARKLGFERVVSAGGDGEALLALARWLAPNEGAILHVRGVDAAVSFDSLRSDGYDFQERVIYKAVQTAIIPDGALMPPPDAVLIYSARSAATFAEAIGAGHAPDLLVLGISETALGPLREVEGLRLIASPHPDESTLLEALREAVPAVKKN